MKRLLLLIMAIAVTVAACDAKKKKSKDEPMDSAAIAAAKAQADIDSLNFVIAKGAMDKLEFFLLAERIHPDSGSPIITNDKTNFIKVYSSKSIIQVSISNYSHGGNGLGGQTIKGAISNPKFKTDKKGNYRMKYRIKGGGLSIMVDIELLAGSNKAIAQVFPDDAVGSFEMQGTLVPLGAEDNVIEGME